MADDPAPTQQTGSTTTARRFVTDADLAKYGDFARHHLVQLSSRRKASPLHWPDRLFVPGRLLVYSMVGCGSSGVGFGL